MTISLRAHWQTVLLSVAVALLTAVGASLLYVRATTEMERQLRERLQGTAAAAAAMIDGDVLMNINGPEDVESPAFVQTVRRLHRLREDLADIRFAYILRATDDRNILSFVADADSVLTDRELDANGNGRVDPDEEPAWPGERYDVSDIPALRGPAFLRPAADQEITVDQWGTLVSGYAPIRDASGRTVAVLGIDMTADRFRLTATSILPPPALAAAVALGIACACLLVSATLPRQIKLLKRVEQERSGMLQLTFHQLGEPVTIMKWSLEMLRDSLTEDAVHLRERINEHIVSMEEGIGRLGNIIDALHQAEKVDLASIVPHRRETSLSSIVRDIADHAEPRLSARSQSLRLDLDEHLVFRFDPELLRIVFQQLIENAMDYSPDGTAIIVSARMRGGMVEVRVRDHGHGIPKEDLKHIMQKYRRANNAAHYKPDGNGLGLYTAAGIIRACGGKLQVDSEEGKGTTVTFTLPLHPAT